MAIIPVSSMIKTLSDFYDPVKAEQVKQLQMKTAEMQEQQAMRQRLADVYAAGPQGQQQEADTQAYMRQVPQALQGMIGLMGGAAGGTGPLAPAIQQAPATTERLTPQIQFDAMDRIQQEYLKSGDVASALTVAKARQSAAGGGQTTFAPQPMWLKDKVVNITYIGGVPHRYGANGLEKVPSADADKLQPVSRSVTGEILAPIAAARRGEREKDVTVTTQAQQEALIPYKIQDMDRSIEQKRQSMELEEEQRIERVASELPVEIVKTLQPAANQFMSQPVMKDFNSTINRTDQVFTSADRILADKQFNEKNADDIRAGKKQLRPTGPDEMGLVYAFVKSFDDNRVTSEEYGQIGLTRGLIDQWRAAYDQATGSGTIIGLPPATINAMKRTAQGLRLLIAKRHDSATALQRDQYANTPFAEAATRFFPSAMSRMTGQKDAPLVTAVPKVANEETIGALTAALPASSGPDLIMAVPQEQDNVASGVFTAPAPRAPLATTPTIQTLYDEQEGMTDEQLFGMNIIPTKIWEGMPPEQRAEWANLGYRPQNIKSEGAAPAEKPYNDKTKAEMLKDLDEILGGSK